MVPANQRLPQAAFAAGLVLLAFVACTVRGMAPPRPRGAAAAEPADPPFGIERRVPWTTSRVTGSPDPPKPYRAERAFPNLRFQSPVTITHAPGTDRLWVVEQRGKIYSFRNDPQVAAADLAIDLPRDVRGIADDERVAGVRDAYGLAFPPDFETSRVCYVCYVLNSRTPGEQLADGTRVSRFRVSDEDPPRIDAASEEVLITWLAGGHNGGCLKFGPRDGYLYISTGDAAAPNPPDALRAGQDVSELLASILRIDVSRAEEGRPYAVPPDNPFVGLAGARPEVWAYGFRNPWKMSFDRESGDLWAGDVGWELWEMVHRVERGGNYGWSLMEGPQPVRSDVEPGPTPVLPPAIALPHSKAASVTGGYVYRGRRLPGLVGSYVFGDWETRRMWAARLDGGKVASYDEITDPTLRVVAFGEDADGELHVLDYDDGTVHTLAENDAAQAASDFPRTLGATGLFASPADHEPAPGVVPFSINAPMWADHATAEYLVALPGESSVVRHPENVPVPGSMFQRSADFPKDAVLVRTASLELERGNPASRRRVETQLLHFDGRNWNGYSYRWNAEQTDAALVDADGAEETIRVTDADAPGGHSEQVWRFSGRGECARCHNPWAQHALAFNTRQLDRRRDYGDVTDDQLRTLEHVGILVPARRSDTKPPALTNPYDESAPLDARARSYLQVNCAHCHQMGAGGTSEIDLRFELPLDRTKTVDARPMQGTFGIADAAVIAPGGPYHSVLYYRMAKQGRGRMPHVGSELVDVRGLRLIREWIRRLPGRRDEAAQAPRLRELGEAAAERRAEMMSALLSTPSGALALAQVLDDGELPEVVRAEVVEAATSRAAPEVRDLFERFLPDERRAKRLGSAVRPEEILRLAGDAERGRALFFDAAGMTCRSCHRAGGRGGEVGPDLSDIGARRTRAELLESLLDPSTTIDPKFAAYAVETAQGQVHTGLLVERTGERVVLRDAQGKEIRIAAADVEQLMPQRVSLMPELLLRDLTPDQAADLLAYLESLREPR